MFRTLIAAVLAIGLSMSSMPGPAKADSPVLGSAKTALLTKDEAKGVTAKGGTAAYYLYLGLQYSSYAIYYAGLSQYYNYYYGYAYYAYDAYYYSSYATSYYYSAYTYAGS